jgi:hypothetical protein
MEQLRGASPGIPKGKLAFLSMLCAAYLLLCWLALTRNSTSFWDAGAYGRAIQTYLAGGDPYAHLYQYNFVYPPIFLHVAAALSRAISFRLLAGIYLAVNCAAVPLIAVVLARVYVPASWLTVAVALNLFACHSLLTAHVAIVSGNISNLLYLDVLVAGIPGLRRNRWLPFYLTVALCSLIKLPFLAFLLLPILLGEGGMTGPIITATTVFTTMFLEQRLWPAQYKGFMDAIAFQIFTLHDAGFGLPRYFFQFHVDARLPLFHGKLAYFLHTAVMAAILYGLWAIRQTRPSHKDPLARSIRIAAILVTVILANPRMTDYDGDVALLPAILLIVESIRVLLDRQINPILLSLPITAFLLLLVRTPTVSLFLLLPGALLLFFVVLSREPAPGMTHGKAILSIS